MAVSGVYCIVAINLHEVNKSIDWCHNVEKARQKEWHHFWPDQPTGTLRVNFRKISVLQVFFVDVFVFALSTVLKVLIELCLFMPQNL